MGEQPEAIAYIDGASRGNPGPAGIGVVLTPAPDEAVVQLYKYLGETTNNVAEYLAFLYALQEAQARGVKRLRIKTDSELLARQVNGQYKVRDQTLRLLHDLALYIMKAFEQVLVEHIDRSQNAHADRLAGEAVDSRVNTSVNTR